MAEKEVSKKRRAGLGGCLGCKGHFSDLKDFDGYKVHCIIDGPPIKVVRPPKLREECSELQRAKNKKKKRAK